MWKIMQKRNVNNEILANEGPVLFDDKTIREICGLNDKSITRAILDSLKAVIAKVRSVLAALQGRNEYNPDANKNADAENSLLAQLGILDEMRALFNDALEVAAEAEVADVGNYESDSNSIKLANARFSLSPTLDEIYKRY